MVTIGYTRVSTDGQAPDSQVDALEGARAERMFVDVASGATQERPQLVACLDYLRAGDTLAVWRLDRFGWSLGHLIEIITRSRTAASTSSRSPRASTRLCRAASWSFTSSGAVAEFEGDLIRERTKAGLEAARRQGRTGGRPTVMTPDRLRIAKTMRRDGSSIRAIAEALGVGRSTVARQLARPEQLPADPPD